MRAQTKAKPLSEGEQIILGVMRPGREYTLNDIRHRLKSGGLIPDAAINAIMRGLVNRRVCDVDIIGDGVTTMRAWKVRAWHVST